MRDDAPGVYWSAAISGAALGISSLPGPFGPLAFVGFVPLLRALERCAPALAARAGLLAGVLYFGLVFGWVPCADLASKPLLAAIYVLGVAILAAGFGGFAWCIAGLARLSPVFALAAAPALWVAGESLHGQEWTLAAPSGLGDALCDWPLLGQAASLGGRSGLTLWVVAVNVGWLLLPRLPRAPRAALAALLCAPFLFGAAAVGAREPATPSLRVAAVQPAIPEAARHRADRLTANLARLLDLSAQALAGPVDLLAWPESAFERNVGAAGDAFLGTVGLHLGVPLLTGAWRTPDRAGSGWRNGAVLSEGGATRWVAEKVHPFRFYERAPHGPLARALARAGLWSGRFAPGGPPRPVLVRAAGAAAPVPIGVLLCVDASYDDVARALRAQGARLLVTLANEAGAGPWAASLNARAARLRAIENGVPVVRVANGGPTLWIDAHGRVRAALAAGAAGASASALALAGAPTLYTRFGGAPVAAGCCATLLTALALALAPHARRARAELARSPVSLIEGVAR